MKLTTRDIAGFMQTRSNAPLVLIYGPDQGLAKNRADILGKFVVPDLTDPFNVATLNAEDVIADPAKFFDETSALSMMGGDRLVRVKNAGDGLTATIKSYLSAPVRGTSVILIAGELSPKSTLRKLIEGDKQAVALPCYIQDARDIARVITDTMRAANLRIEPEAVTFLSNALTGDAGQVTSELQKLLTYMGVDAGGQGNGATLTQDDARACSGAMASAELDTFVDALMLGQTAAAFTALQRLQDDEVNMMMILRSLLAHGRKIQATHLRLAAGERLDDMLNDKFNPPVFFKRKAAFTAQMRAWPLPRLQHWMNDILILEGKFKSGRDAGASIPQGLLSLCVRASKHAA